LKALYELQNSNGSEGKNWYFSGALPDLLFPNLTGTGARAGHVILLKYHKAKSVKH